MSNVVVEKTGLFQRLKSAFTGILVGLIFLVISVPLMFWNEWTAVSAYQSLQEGAGLVISVDADPIDPSNEGKLVHVVGDVSVSDALNDATFGIQADDALRLRRVVEMYQWKEKKNTSTEKNVGGSETRTTTYSYEQVWSNTLISSSGFNDTSMSNPSSMPFSSESFDQGAATLGAFTLDRSLISKFSNFQTLQVPATALNRAESSVKDSFQVHGGTYYRGESPNSPQVGDVRVSFQVAPAARSTLVGKQTGTTLTNYTTKNGRDLLFVKLGEVSSEQVFDDAIASNTLMTWVLRGVAFFMVFIGVRMLFGPIAVLSDVVPFLGKIARAGIGMVSALVAVPFSLLIIAIAWIVARPLLGIFLVLVSGMFIAALVALIVFVARRGGSAEAEPA